MATDPTTTPDLATVEAHAAAVPKRLRTPLLSTLTFLLKHDDRNHQWLYRRLAEAVLALPVPAATTPELLLSPDGKRIAGRHADGGWWWRDINGPYFSAIATPEEFEGWTPLVPAPAAAEVPGLQDRYSHTWMLLPGETDWWWSQCKGIALDRAAIDAEAGPLDDVDVQVPPMPAPATVDRDAVHMLISDAIDPDGELPELGSRADAVFDVLVEHGYLRAPVAAPAADDQEPRTPGDEVVAQYHQTRRVAQAIHDAQCGCDRWTAHESEDDDPSYLLMADAAIAALREVPDA